MANINNLKIGSSDPDRIMYGSRHSSPDIFYKFTEWKLNPSYKNVVEVTDEKIIIKKFKPNVWIIHSPEVNGPFAKTICKYCNGFRANITGLNAHLSILSTEYHTFSNHGAGNDTPKFRGLCSTRCILMGYLLINPVMPGKVVGIVRILEIFRLLMIIQHFG